MQVSEDSLGVNEEPEVSKTIIAPAESISKAESISRNEKIDSCNSSVVKENVGASEQRKDGSTITSFSDSGQVSA